MHAGPSSDTWNGTISGDWNTSGNWSISVPDSTTAAIFGSSSTYSLTFSSAGAALGLTFNTGGSAYTFANNGYTLTIYGSGIINNNKNVTQTFNTPLVVGAAQTWNAASGGLTFNTVTLSNALTVTGSSNVIVTGVVSDIGGLTKNGTGTLTLSGTNTYTGATTVSAGVLNIQNNTALGTGAASVTSGATLQVQGGLTNVTNAITLNGLGAVGGGGLALGALDNLSGTNTISGAITLGGNTTINSDAGTLNLTTGGITGNYNLTVGGASNTSISGVIGTGSGTLTKAGAGTLVLSGANTYTGATSINAGTLQISVDNNLGTALGPPTPGQLSFNGGTLKTTATLTLSSNRGIGLVSGGTLDVAAGTILTYGGIIANSGAAGAHTLTKIDSGTLVLTGTNTYTGATNINGGILTINQDSNLGTPPSLGPTPNDLNLNGGTLQTAATMTLNANRGISLGASGGTLDVNSGYTLTYGGIIAGSGALTKADSGTLILSGANTYTGATTISAGILQLGATNVLPSSTAVTIGTGPVGGVGGGTPTLDLNNFSTTVGSIAGTGKITLGSGTLTTGGNNTSTTFSGVISDSGNLGNLTKTGTGNLTLSGTNTYTGATNINGGILTINQDSNLGTAQGSPTVNDLNLNGGTLQTAATMTLNANRGITLGASGGTLDVNPGTTLTYGGIVTGTGSLTKTDSGTLVLSGVNTYTGATNISAGTLQLGAANALSSGTAVTVAGGATLTLNNYSDTVGSLAGSGVVTLGSGTLIVGDTTNASSTFSGSFSNTSTDTGIFEKSGTGTLTFGAAMTLSNGTLQLNGGTLNLGGYNSTFLSLSVTANSTLDFGASGNSTLNLTSLTVGSGVILTITNWADAADYFFSRINPGADSLGRIVFNGFTGADTKWLSYDNQITPVPEPATYGAALLGLSILFAGWRRYRRRTS
jgi:autotransporter-associated beta strand protein